MALRIKEIMESKGLTNTTLSTRMGVTKQAVGQMVKAESLTTATLDKIADALGVPTWQLIASPKEVATDIEESKGGFSSFIRYKGIHYTADTLDEFFKQVDELKIIAR
jgi:transcriptional regulator with XRE-family HTH domain